VARGSGGNEARELRSEIEKKEKDRKGANGSAQEKKKRKKRCVKRVDTEEDFEVWVPAFLGWVGRKRLASPRKGWPQKKKQFLTTLRKGGESCCERKEKPRKEGRGVQKR